MMVSMIMMMVVRLSSHIHNGCRHRQHRGILILNELTDALYDKKERAWIAEKYKARI